MGVVTLEAVGFFAVAACARLTAVRISLQPSDEGMPRIGGHPAGAGPSGDNFGAG